MAERPVETGTPARSHRRAATVAAALLPLLVGMGFFAPGWVLVALQGAGSAAAAPGAPPSAFEHRPLPAPPDPAIHFAPIGLELDRLFVESFPRHDTDPIVLDQLGPVEEPIVFKDALMPDQPIDLALPDQGELFLPLCPTIPATNCIRFDDFTTVRAEVPIPEPGTGSLVAAGLALLAAASRRRSR